MTQIAALFRMQPFTPTGLSKQARALHQPRILWGNIGWLCVCSAVALSILGIAAIYTVPRPKEPDYALRQIVFLGVGCIAATAIALPHYRWMQRFNLWLLLAAMALLLFVLMPGVPEAIVRPRNGARRWINLGITDFQPSELAKIAYIIALANYLRVRQNHRSFIGLIAPLALSFIPMSLVLIEPNLGMALLFLPTFFAMLIAAGARVKHIVLIVVLGLALAPLSYPMLRDHQKARIDALWAQIRGDPRHEGDIGYQGARAMTLVGAGGWLGNGAEKTADLVVYNHLPEDHNDMVFAVICCRWGMLGGLTVWLLAGAFCLGGMVTAAQCKDPFGRLVAVGIIATLFSQMAINIGMTIGILPITGLPLPFVSYGGSSMVATWIMVGLLLSIAMRRPKYLARDSFEFDDETVEQPTMVRPTSGPVARWRASV